VQISEVRRNVVDGTRCARLVLEGTEHGASRAGADEQAHVTEILFVDDWNDMGLALAVADCDTFARKVVVPNGELNEFVASKA
jgi:hypothetical protein